MDPLGNICHPRSGLFYCVLQTAVSHVIYLLNIISTSLKRSSYHEYFELIKQPNKKGNLPMVHNCKQGSYDWEFFFFFFFLVGGLR